MSIDQAVLSKLTLVIPTFNRQNFVLRTIAYWAGKGPNVIVVDGSPSSIDQIELDKIPSNVRYIFEPSGIFDRLRTALDHVDTEFVALLADDEFFIPSALSNCLDQLIRDSELVACCGRSLAFGYKNASVFGVPMYSQLENYQLNEEEPEERLLKHMLEYAPSLIYAVCRASHWKNSWNCILEHEFSFFASAEIQFSMLMSCAGKSKVIPELMWLRSRGENSNSELSNPKLNKSFITWVTDPDNSVEHETFLSIMARGMSELASIPDQQKCREFMIIALQAFVIFKNEEADRNAIRKLLRGMRSQISPKTYRETLDKLSALIQRRNEDNKVATDLVSAAKSLQSAGVSVDVDVVREIELRVRAFHG